MQRPLLLVLFVGCGILSGWLYIKDRVPRHTYYGTTNVSFKTQDELLALLAREQFKIIRIKVKNREYRFTIKELGIVYDLNKTAQDVFIPHVGKKEVRPFLEFTPAFFEKGQKTVFSLSPVADTITVDSDDKTLRYVSRMEKYRVNSKDLQILIRKNWFLNLPLSPQLLPLVDFSKQQEFVSYNDKLRRVSQKPITVVMKDSTTSSAFTVSPDEIKNMSTVQYDETRGQILITIKEDTLKTVVKNKVKLSDFSIDFALLKSDLTELALNRFNGEDANYIEAVLTESANTNGNRSPRYIEIDISQQNMYIWENGENIARYRISSGLYYPTPPGEYTILNKALNAYSDIYHVWMPYWMAFYRDPKVNAYLGIHELPYFYTGNGDQIRRPRDFIGSPHTGGCVSLDIGEAEKVYNWAEVGTQVYVYE